MCWRIFSVEHVPRPGWHDYPFYIISYYIWTINGIGDLWVFSNLWILYDVFHFWTDNFRTFLVSFLWISLKIVIRNTFNITFGYLLKLQSDSQFCRIRLSFLFHFETDNFELVWFFSFESFKNWYRKYLWVFLWIS